MEGGQGGRPVVLEWPHPGVHDREAGRLFWSRHLDPGESFVRASGSLVLLQEIDLIQLEPLPPERLVAEILAERLAGRRRIAAGQGLFFRRLFRQLALERLGLGPERGAVVGPLRGDYEAAVKVPALTPEYWSEYWRLRFPALISALESRMGAEPLRAAVEELLARGEEHPDRGPATVEELYALLIRHGPPDGSVERLIRDAFQEGHLPEPGLDGVRFTRSGGGWRATGRVVNTGRGAALCKVVLHTELGPESVRVRAGEGEAAPFDLATRHRPRGVFLDPDGECHRLVRNSGTVDRVHFEGESR